MQRIGREISFFSSNIFEIPLRRILTHALTSCLGGTNSSKGLALKDKKSGREWDIAVALEAGEKDGKQVSFRLIPGRYALFLDFCALSFAMSQAVCGGFDWIVDCYSRSDLWRLGVPYQFGFPSIFRNMVPTLFVFDPIPQFRMLFDPN